MVSVASGRDLGNPSRSEPDPGRSGSAVVSQSDREEAVEVLADWVRDARACTIDLVGDLEGDQLIGPKLPTINPLRWEIGHAAWFQERWVLQHVAGQPPLGIDGWNLYDSIGIAHEDRWDLPLPAFDATVRYICEVRDRVLEVLERGDPSPELIYFVKLSVFHEDMHNEAFTYTRQTLGYREPRLTGTGLSLAPCPASTDDADGDVEISGGEFLLGADRGAPFVFDNEKWSHPVTVEPFAIARTAVTAGEFQAFVDDGGYERRELWSDDGWNWRREAAAEHPLFWRRDGDGWLRRKFDCWVPLEPNHAMEHVNWYEAEAWCRWAGRRLPTEVEWERAACGSVVKRHYPWGQASPAAEHANMDWRAMGTVPAGAYPAGDSAGGCRQMLGNVWEWTATTLGPYPGFTPDPYEEYSRCCFGECKVLRGGCWASRSRMLRNTWRNFYRPDRRDVFAGFRTCAIG